MTVSKKIIQRRIKSVRNTRKITKAMELVAAAKMRRAAMAVVKTRPYAQLAWQTVQAVMQKTGDDVTHPLMVAKPGATRTLFVLFASDRGLAGGYNVNILRQATQFVRQEGAGNVDVIAIGKRAEAIAKAGVPIIAAFPGLTNAPQFKDILPIVRLVIEQFTSGVYAKVVLGFTDYVSGITQRPNIMTMLPMKVVASGQEPVVSPNGEYTFEPNPQLVLDRVLPGLIETQVFHALLESTASEHAARMMAMRNASDSASDMLDSLTFTYNQARQAAITQEIAELVSGAAAQNK